MKPNHDPVVEYNIRSIYDREESERKKAPKTHQIAHHVAEFSGSVLFIGIHMVLFAMWIIFNVIFKIDPYPFNFLTMMVSLESIFLAAFVMLSQNKAAQQEDRRNKLDLQINLLAEKESTAMIKVLIELGKRAGMSAAQLKELEDLSNDIEPADILQQIQDIESPQK